MFRGCLQERNYALTHILRNLKCICEHLIPLNTEIAWWKSDIAFTKKKSWKFSFHWGQSCKSTADIAINLPLFKSWSVWTLDKSYNTSAGGHVPAALTQGSRSLNCHRLCGLIYCDNTDVPHFAVPIDNGIAHLRSKICKCSPKAISFEITSLSKWLLLYESFTHCAHLKLMYSLSAWWLWIGLICFRFFLFFLLTFFSECRILQETFSLSVGCAPPQILTFFLCNSDGTHNWPSTTFTASTTQHNAKKIIDAIILHWADVMTGKWPWLPQIS